MWQPIKQLRRFQDLSVVKWGPEVVRRKSSLFLLMPSFRLRLRVVSLSRSPLSKTANKPREKKWPPEIPGREARKISCFYRVSLDELSEKRSTRGLAVIFLMCQKVRSAFGGTMFYLIIYSACFS